MEDRKIYFGYFKCRMCGKEFYSFSCSTESEAMERFKYQKERIVYHHHENGDLGVSDFIGFKLEEKR